MDSTCVHVWAVETGEKLFTFDSKSPITSFAFDSFGRRIILGCQTGEVLVYNHLSGQQLKSLMRSKTGEVTNVQYLSARKGVERYFFGASETTFMGWRDGGAFWERLDFSVTTKCLLLCMAVCPPATVAIGTNKGGCVWRC